jgi:Na+/pantothenate symporter
VFTVYFDWDSWKLTAEQLKVLTDVINSARAGGQTNIIIVGHTDTSGPADYNQKLSVRRANVVVEALVDMGARRAETTAQSLGASRRMTLVWGVVLGLLALIPWGPVLVAGLTIASITYGALLGVFLLGTWNKRANEGGALVGFAAGLATMIAVNRFTPLAWTWYVLTGTIVTFAVGTIASQFSRSATTPVDVPLQ